MCIGPSDGPAKQSFSGHALSFVEFSETAEDADPERIRRKLEVGLDVVLQEEAAEPVEVAKD